MERNNIRQDRSGHSPAERDSTTDHNSKILPVPSDLDEQLWEFSERIEEIRRDLLAMQRRYNELRKAPESMRVDSLGEPTTPEQATERVLTALVGADARLAETTDTLAHARRSSSRLALTDAAAEQREQLLDEAERRQRPHHSR
ncbi:hypothetical protein [Nocardia xishanensis]|uniref:hypothetical protein n=1 Tax=Nocardia xishanensis TaxID=238964 RepID=UPI0034173BE5